MSGPKTSRYKLTPAQRRMLIAQRERQRRCGEASAFLASIRTKLCRLKQFPADELERAEILMQRTDEHVYSEKRDELCQRVQEAIEKIDEVKGSNDPALLERTLEQAKQEYERLLNLRGELDGISCEIAAQLRWDVNGGIDKAFSADLSGLGSEEERRSAELREAIFARVERFSSPELSEPLKLDVMEVRERLAKLNSADELSNFSALTVAPLEKRCREYEQLRREHGVEFDRLTARYHALCGELGRNPEAVTLERGAVQRLETLSAELEAEIQHAEEQAYINRCIDEVMEEMGYRLIGNRSVVKRSGTRLRSELYSFSEGTAVNVTYSSGGSITMELGAADVRSRLPGEDEAKRLTEDMRSFCGSFKEFGRRLLEKGVEAEHLSLLPPEPEYAQVIDISGYEMTGESARDFTAAAPKEMSADE